VVEWLIGLCLTYGDADDEVIGFDEFDNGSS